MSGQAGNDIVTSTSARTSVKTVLKEIPQQDEAVTANQEHNHQSDYHTHKVLSIFIKKQKTANKKANHAQLLSICFKPSLG